MRKALSADLENHKSGWGCVNRPFFGKGQDFKARLMFGELESKQTYLYQPKKSSTIILVAMQAHYETRPKLRDETAPLATAVRR